ncbi:hypothetical protein MKY37_20685 [Psychrobacillus sp. FSL K6-2836]
MSEDIASAVKFAIDTPERMSISDMIVRPTSQQVKLYSVEDTPF